MIVTLRNLKTRKTKKYFNVFNIEVTSDNIFLHKGINYEVFNSKIYRIDYVTLGGINK